MPTYSTGTPPTDAVKLQDLNTVLSALPDNTSKLISPKDVRDAVYTLWENIMFKPTSNSGGTEYIGIDKADFREKILVGKKTVGGNPVLNSTLLSGSLNPQVDVFFYNTRTEPQSNYNTTVAFLAGTGSNFFGTNLTAPYLRSLVIGANSTIDFEIVNPSFYTIGATNYGGNISILSENGSLFLNGVRFPTLFDNSIGISQQDYVLKYKMIGAIPTAVWEAPVTASAITSLFSAGTVSITGSPVILNNLPIDFTYNTPTPVTIGGIPAGSTFSGVPVTEMIRKILYPYIAPEVTSNISPSLVEVGDSNIALNVLEFTFNVFRNATYSLNTINYTPSPVTPLVPGTLVVPGSIPNNANSTYIVRPPLNTTSISTGTTSYIYFDFGVALSDTYVTNISSTSSLALVIPWYYGSATISTTQSSGGLYSINSILGTSSTPQTGKLTPILFPPVLSATSSYNKTIELTTFGLSGGNQGYIYFGYPADFPDLQDILDPNGYTVSGSFLKFNVSGVNSPVGGPGFWTGKDYKFYIFVGSASGSTAPLATTIGSPPYYNGSYKFNFA